VKKGSLELPSSTGGPKQGTPLTSTRERVGEAHQGVVALQNGGKTQRNNVKHTYVLQVGHACMAAGGSGHGRPHLADNAIVGGGGRLCQAAALGGHRVVDPEGGGQAGALAVPQLEVHAGEGVGHVLGEAQEGAVDKVPGPLVLCNAPGDDEQPSSDPELAGIGLVPALSVGGEVVLLQEPIEGGVRWHDEGGLVVVGAGLGLHLLVSGQKPICAQKP